MFIHKNTTLARHGWELESAVERNEASPATFPIPSENVRRALQFGDRVKLLFLLRVFSDEHPNGIVACERMWVAIIDASDGEYIGLLESEPRSSGVLQPDAALRFQPQHICDIMPRPTPAEFTAFQNTLRTYVATL